MHLLPWPSQPSRDPSLQQTCPLLPVTTTLLQTRAAFIKSSRIVLAPDFSASPGQGCPLPQRRPGICQKQGRSAKLCRLTGTSTSKTQGHLDFSSWRQLIEINLVALAPALEGEQFPPALMEVLFLTYISAEMMSRQDIKLASLY